ncbi:MAG TPA: metallophosphoesterase family protein [Gaiellaceae bacterium]|jgi:putative phosphoesterase
MRVAALYDVHGNRPALEAVLAELEGERIDEVVFGGDLTWGPQPRETLELVRSVEKASFVRGNADREPDDWERSCLSDEEVAFLQGQAPTIVRDSVLYCHATPRSDDEVVTPATPDERLAEILAGVEQRVVVAGHTHMQQNRVVGGVRFVNAGSVGLPYEGEIAAFWALLVDGEPQLRKTPVDHERVVEAYRRSQWPRATEILDERIVRAATREEATKVLEGRASAVFVPPGG